ncbi:MAG: right-handed parallel beta-helix repeat-containing protein, partial [Bdellovibrionales bacterium]|nr:right-handed parallel beta-helix repeat-containing protein [Bdellovibrionales bacterium]
INALEISRFTSDQDYLVENSAATFSTLNIDIAEYARIRRAIIVNNQGNGAVFLRGTSSEITDNLINMNSYADFGNPAVTMVSSTRAIVTHNSFKDNSGGGALNIFTAPSTVIESNRFVNNRGGQVYLDDMYYFPAFDLFIQASLDNSSRIAYNNFIQSEPESARHTFIYLGSHEFPRQLVMANIFSDTDYGDALALDCASGSPELVSHSLQWGASVSTNCGPQHDQAINADPQFRNDGEYYRLQSTSPAIGEGPGSANIGVWQGE